MSQSLRLPADMIHGWLDLLGPHRGVRGIAPTALEMEALLNRKGADDHVVVPRSQLESWAKALEGAVRLVPFSAASQVQDVLNDVRATMGAPPVAAPAGYDYQPAAVRPATPTPSVTYASSPAAASSGYAPVQPPPLAPGTRFVPENETPGTTEMLFKEAKQEILLVSPWITGVDSLMPYLDKLKDVRVRIVTRKPEPEDSLFRESMTKLNQRGADVAFSPHLQTRMLVVDRARLYLGAASYVSPAFRRSREVAILTTERAVVDEAVRHFEKVHAEAKAGR